MGVGFYMEFLRELFANKVFLAGLFGWCVAQVSKTIIVLIITKKFEIERLFGGGGMPSSHSATVCGLATATGMIYGGGSIEFAFMFWFAMIVMYDAMNVRMETGRQGKALNELIEVMTFGKPRYNKKYEWELLRLCTKFGYIVSGGANKLIKYFIRIH